MMPLLIAAALVFGLLLILAGRDERQRRGLTDAWTLDLDSRTLYSAKYGLTSRPDRLIRDGAAIIPEEWKSARRVYDSHRAQMGVYFLLLEEDTCVRPPHGFIVTGDGTRHLAENTAELRTWVLRIVDQIRVARRQMAETIQVSQPPAKCRTCGQRDNCGQARG